ncbi:hypothetical protein LTR53_016729, partial [Teratosphaeriaceae sp. CCFEE 6253]
MASTGWPHSFFADEMHHHRDEQSVCEELLRMPLALAQPPALPNFAFRPLLPTQPAAIASAPAPQRLSIQIPGVLANVVKTDDFSPISDDDWAHASIEYEAASPASATSMTDSPVTPGLEGSSQESYTERFFSEGHHANNSVALAYAQGLGCDEKPFTPPPPPYTGPPGHYLDAALAQLHAGETPIAPFADPYLGYHMGVYGHTLQAQPAPQHRSFPGSAFAPPQPGLPSSHPGDETFLGGHVSMSDSEDSGSQRSGASIGALAPHARGSVSDDESAGNERDAILVQRRREGWTYRKIKEHYKFSEAEPTLRGRHRMLTKDKEERVRRPV